MKNNQYRSSSRRRTPWDESTDPSSLQSFIRDEYKEHYAVHHPKLSETKESELLNSYRPDRCPYCGLESFRKNGFSSNRLQKYRCTVCRRNFVITTGTIFDSHRISVGEWIEYLLNLFGHSSLNLNSKTNKNSPTTSKYWLAKVFAVLKDCQKDTVLKGRVEIDETYFSVGSFDTVTKDGKKLRGISRNKYCIAIGCDSEGTVYLNLEGKGKPSIRKTEKAFASHIEKGSVLVHDKEHSHSVLVSLLELKSEEYASSFLLMLPDEENPLRHVNRCCFLLKNFLHSHPGFSREELQDYLNLFSFMMNAPENKLEKVERLLEMSIKTRVRLKYRDYYSK